MFPVLPKSFQLHLSAGSNPGVKNRSSVTAPLTSPELLPSLPSHLRSDHTLHYTMIPCSLPITIHCYWTGTAPSDIRTLGAEVQSCFLFAQGTQIGCQSSAVQKPSGSISSPVPHLCTHRGIDLINAYLDATIWSNQCWGALCKCAGINTDALTWFNDDGQLQSENRSLCSEACQTKMKEK